jgi:pimeloyl-ACP methyl ester carboxylesterase
MWADRDETYGPDHFHPSALGHARWAEHARPVLEAALDAAGRRRAEPAAVASPRPRVPPIRQTYSYVRTRQGTARIRDEGGDGTVVVVMPDSPNVLEHHESSFRILGRDFRVVGLEMPGAGYTDLHPPTDDWPAGSSFDYSLASGARWILDVLEALDVERAILTASCVNGLYSAMAAQLAPDRVEALVLCQTPSLAQLKRWAKAQIPGPLRNRAVGDLIVRVGRRPLAARWYRQVVAPTASIDDRLWFEDLAYEGFRYGSVWRLAPLVNALLREPDDAIGELAPPTYLLWGGADGSHLKAGTDPATAPGPPVATRPVATGHFPDLEDPETFALAVRVAAGLEDPTVFG